MGENSAHHPLLLSSDGVCDYVKKTPVWASSLKCILKITMWVIFIAWVTIIFLYPCDFFRDLYGKYTRATEGTVFGTTGSIFLLYSGPILIIAFLAIAYLIIRGEEEFQEMKVSKFPCFRLWTFPVIVDGPVGVVSATEVIGVLLVWAYVVWAISVYTAKNANLLFKFQLTFKEASVLMLELTGFRFGAIGLFCLAFLFIPVARGSILLRLIDIPFEHATRYHVWLGHLTMLIFTLHGLFYVIAWAVDGRLLREILQWKNIGIANLAGVISLAAGILMWLTSFHPVRRQYFELFFYTHQLYVIFVVFLALHVGDFIFTISAGGIFIFMLDRFLRFCQSRRTVKILSASCLPCGTVELVLSKPANLKYNALSFIFVQVRELSWLQWHPFSVSSSPLDGKYHMSILIKVLGEWTEKLRGNVLNVHEYEPTLEQPLQPQPSLTASVEGPYGHESPYHLMYENLILVAGGIGISPFLAILSDILHRIRDGKPCLLRNVLVVWAVKNSNELPLLYTLNIQSICPNLSDMLNLDIQTYVTRESEPKLEEGKVSKPINSPVLSIPNNCSISNLVGTGHILWSGAYVVVSTVGLVVSVALLDTYYINSFGIESWWYKGLLFVACMAVSVIVFGGIVVGLWHVWDRKTSAREVCKEDGLRIHNVQHSDSRAQNESVQDNMASSNAIHYGRRPDFKEIFESISDSWGCVDIGVIVCGPPTLSSSVAKECRSQSLRRRGNQPIFHFNSHSFDL